MMSNCEVKEVINLNPITSYLIQTNKISMYEVVEYTWNWEVKLAKGANGKYLGYAKEATKPFVHTQRWIETETDNLDEALEIMKNICESKTG